MEGIAMPRLSRLPWVVTLALLDVFALVRLRPSWRDIGHDLSAPHHWLAEVGPDRAAITLGGVVLWCLALWLALGLAAIVASSAPGTAGRCAKYVLRRLWPSALVRLVAGVAGVSVLIAPVAAG